MPVSATTTPPSSPTTPTPAPATTTTASATASTTTTPPTSATIASTADSCSVITQSEAGNALSQAVKAPVMGKAWVEGGHACVFYGPGVPVGTNPDVPVTNSVRVVLVNGSQAKMYYDDYKTKIPAKDISGFGDQAYYDGSMSISVMKGSSYLRVAVIGVPDVLKAEEQLATVALSRM